MIAAESVPTIKPPGRVLQAIDHDRLLQVMRSFGPAGVVGDLALGAEGANIER